MDTSDTILMCKKNDSSSLYLMLGSEGRYLISSWTDSEGYTRSTYIWPTEDQLLSLALYILADFNKNSAL